MVNKFAIPEIRKLANKNYLERYPEKRKASSFVRNHKIKPKNNKNQFHHWSYNQEHWLDVIELSVKKHRILHRHIVYDQERMMYRIANGGELLDTREAHESFMNEIFKKVNN